MSRFDWADQGVFDISDLSDEDFKDLFNTMEPAKKAEILAAMREATDDAEAKAKAVAFVLKAGELAMKVGTILV